MTAPAYATPNGRIGPMTLAENNRRLWAERLKWPPGALEECERLDVEYWSWSFSWRPESTIKGFEHPAGYVAVRSSGWFAGADETQQPDDGRPRRPAVFALEVDELERRIASMEERIADDEARGRRLSAWMRP